MRPAFWISLAVVITISLIVVSLANSSTSMFGLVNLDIGDPQIRSEAGAWSIVGYVEVSDGNASLVDFTA
jgi:hypothetical protein